MRCKCANFGQYTNKRLTKNKEMLYSDGGVQTPVNRGGQNDTQEYKTIDYGNRRL